LGLPRTSGQDDSGESTGFGEHREEPGRSREDDLAVHGLPVLARQPPRRHQNAEAAEPREEGDGQENPCHRMRDRKPRPKRGNDRAPAKPCRDLLTAQNTNHGSRRGNGHTRGIGMDKSGPECDTTVHVQIPV